MGATHGMVVVGAGLAGAKAAETLRKEGFDGPVTLVGEEPYRPYERPPLSKGYLLGSEEREKAFVHPEAWYAEHDVELRLASRVVAIDVSAHEVQLADDERLPYQALLLATGAEPVRLPVPGADLPGVHYLRRLPDSDALKEAFVGATAREGGVVVIGGGWIGLEVAAAARTSGLDVTVLESSELPLLRVLGPEMAEVFASVHRENGVRLRCGVRVERLVAGGGGRAVGVQLASGEVLPAGLVVVGVGVRPNTALAEGAGLDVKDGVVVDERLRTSHPDIFAAGDVANAYHPFYGRHLRVEHWANALRQGPVAARSMLGRDVAYARVPYFFTDQYDLGMEYNGFVPAGGYDRVLVRGDVAGRRFVAFWLAEGRVLAGMGVNVWDTSKAVTGLITSRREVDLARLADPEVPLEEV